jgi:NADPH-dependent curcumin reductase CurA
VQSTQIVLAARPDGEPTAADFDTVTVDLPPLQDGQVLLRVRYLSLDPYMRGRMSEAESYADPVAIGDVMAGGTVCEVVESRSDRRTVGDLVLSYSGWQTHAVADARAMRSLDPDAAPVSTALGVLGMPGFAAYAGLLLVGKPAPGETVVVAAATGPVGSAVGQIARIKGARAVGIAGGPRSAGRWSRSSGSTRRWITGPPTSATGWPRRCPTASTSTSRTSGETWPAPSCGT